ncbi:MAG: phage tail tape measure protein [Bacteroidales bacterium]|nr:phage tail tape measure protein [Bacteroidales bacterium]
MGNSTISITFTVKGDGQSFKALANDADGIKKAFDAASNAASSFGQSIGGKMQRQMSGMVSQLTKMTATVVGLRALWQVAKNGVEVFRDFEESNSELAAVLGTTIDGVSDLAESAKNLGATTRYTASEVTQLQIALARLGFDTGQIRAMEGSVLNFALAMRTDLGSAAEFTGSALRAFGLSSSDTSDLLDVMSASTTNSALNFSKLQTSISIVGPIARAFGLDVKETASFLGVLANSGFDASSSATALRNILLNLAQANGKLAAGIGHSAKSFDEIIAAFRELQEKGVDVGSVLEMTDKRTASAASALISMADDAETLKLKLDEAGGSLDAMADTMADNLSGAINSVKSAWQGWMLELASSKGILKDVANGLADYIRMFYGKAGFQVERKEMREEMKGVRANNLAATLTNGGTLSDKERKEYEKLLAEGYIVQRGFEEKGIDSWFKEGKDYYKLGRRSNEFGTWGDWTKMKLSESEINQYKDYLKSLNNGGTPTGDPDAGAKALKKLQKEAREAAEEIAEINRKDAEFAALADKEYKEWREAHGLGPIQPFDNDLLLAFEKKFKEVVDLEKEAEKRTRDFNRMMAMELDLSESSIQYDLDKIQDQINRSLSPKNTLQSIEGVSGAFEGLTDVIAALNGGVEDSAAGWLKWTASLLQSVSRAIPALTALAAGEAAASAAQTPIVGAIAAAAAIASTIASFASLPKFASGGLVYGPTLGVMGEYPGAASNPEVVGKLSDIRKYIDRPSVLGGAPIQFKIQGRDLVAILGTEYNIQKRS